MNVPGVVALPLILLGSWAAVCVHAQPSSPALPPYAQERAERAAELTQPYGWFSLVALNWIKPGINTVGSAAGNSIVLSGAPAHLLTLEQKDGKVFLRAADASLILGGKRPNIEAGLVVTDGEEDASALASGSFRMWAIDRGGQRYLRVKDSEAPALKHFHGLNWYPPSTKYRLDARWIPNQHPLIVVNKLGQKTPVNAPGYVEFEWEGKTQRLTPMTAGKEGLFFVFLDSTARKTTDGGGRFLSAEAPSGGLDKPGQVLLDFNQAVNPPCAYSPYATCPLASPENRLHVPIPAGEERYDLSARQ